MNNALIRTAVAALALVAGTAAAAPAGQVTVATVTVDYSDLNLATPAGTARLYQRLRAAARTVCNDAGPRDLDALGEARACRDAALERAVADVGQPGLAALHRARGSVG